MKQAIWFVIVTFYPKDAQLVSLTNTLKDWPVVIVDNTPLSRSSKAKFKWPENITLVQNWANLGYGAGANKGISYALKQGAQWVVILNQDLKVEGLGMGDFVKNLTKNSPAIVGPFAGNLDHRRWTTILPAVSDKIDYISGSFLGLHRKVIETVDNFYPPYFMYYEDVDICKRAQRSGFPLKKVDIKNISHQESASLGRGSMSHQYYLARNHLLFIERQAPLRVKLHEILRLPKTVYEHYQRQETGALLGVRDYCLRRFGAYQGNL